MNSSALIYKVQDYGESSKLLFVYTPNGKYTFVAKGAKNYKNNFFSLADYFNLIEVELDLNKPMQTLKKGKLVNDYEDIKKDYNNFKIASKILNIIDKLLVNVSHHDRLFKLIINLLDYKDLELAYLSLLVKLTYSLGYRLTFNNEDILGFNLHLGRTITNSKEAPTDLDLTLTLYLKILYYGKEESEVDKSIIHQLLKFIKEYYLYHLDYNIDNL